MAESSKAVYASLAGNTAVATTKLIAATATGSSSMFSEGLHSVVDAANELLLLLGKKRSKLPPDEAHPFGHGQELYFWTLIVSLIIFTGGGAISIYEGILRARFIRSRRKSRSGITSFLAPRRCSRAASFVIGYRQFRKAYPNRSFRDVVKSAKDPTIFTVVFEDASDLAGLLLAFLGVFLSARSVPRCSTDSPRSESAPPRP